jgi:hypothetical protein
MFPAVLGRIPESLRYATRMVLLVTAVVGELVIIVTYEPLHLKGTGSLYMLTFARDQGLKPQCRQSPGSRRQSQLSSLVGRFTDAHVPKSGFCAPG